MESMNRCAPNGDRIDSFSVYLTDGPFRLSPFSQKRHAEPMKSQQQPQVRNQPLFSTYHRECDAVVPSIRPHNCILDLARGNFKYVYFLFQYVFVDYRFYLFQKRRFNIYI